MSERKWTKGPWFWSNRFPTEDGRDTWSLLGDGGYGILCCDGEGNSPQGIHDDPNASLIAAAPDLYEALARARDLLERTSSAYFEDVGQGSLRSTVIAALQRAEGEV